MARERAEADDVKVTYTEAGTVRVLRGRLVSDAPDRVVVAREGGTVELARSIILKVERRLPSATGGGS